MFASSLSAHATTGHSRADQNATTRVIPVTQVSNRTTSTIQKSVYMVSYGDTLPPIGYVQYCRRERNACHAHGPFIDRIRLTAARKAELVAVNNYVNEKIKPETDLQQYGVNEYWTIPKTAGDCEDYVLLKREMLMNAGWPESTLLITVVRDENNQGHAILTVRTDRGDFILDNKRPQIVSWNDTPYSYVSRQSEMNPLVWISLVPPGQRRQTPISASQSNR